MLEVKNQLITKGENMRKKLIAGNWKMNCLKADGVALATAVAEKTAAASDMPIEVLICPPMSLLGLICELPHAG